MEKKISAPFFVNVFSLLFNILTFCFIGRVCLECQLRDPKAMRFELENWLWTENIVLVLRRLLLLRIYHCELDWLLRLLLLLLSTAAMAVDGFLGMLTTSDHASVVSMNLFVALLCACILIGHLLEENRWINESIIALAVVSIYVFILYVYMRAGMYASMCVYMHVCCVCLWVNLNFWWQGLCTGIVILLTTGGKSSHLLVFSEDLFFIYLLPPIIFNAGWVWQFWSYFLFSMRLVTLYSNLCFFFFLNKKTILLLVL